MTTIICTMTDCTFEPGCAALLNSLYQNGYRGQIIVGKLGSGHQLPRLIERTSLPGLSIQFVSLPDRENVNFHKPSLLLRCFQDPSVSSAFFFDSDIVCTTDWRHYKEWLFSGIAVCSDINNLWMPSDHPMRSFWKRLLVELGYEDREVTGYANGGFLGLSRSYLSFINVWQELLSWLTDREKPNWDGWTLEAGFKKYDQDLLNAALMAVDFPISFVGYEGMSFASSVGYMVHSIGSKKPWHKDYLKALIKNGNRLPLAARQYWKYVDQPIRAASKTEQVAAKIEMDVTSILSRLIAR
jgi:lipopolysaccharide biosynthesis glycosyltransferase